MLQIILQLTYDYSYNSNIQKQKLDSTSIYPIGFKLTKWQFVINEDVRCKWHGFNEEKG